MSAIVAQSVANILSWKRLFVSILLVVGRRPAASGADQLLTRDAYFSSLVARHLSSVTGRVADRLLTCTRSREIVVQGIARDLARGKEEDEKEEGEQNKGAACCLSKCKSHD